MILQKETIFWDWNGTLLDDTDICINSMNTLLEEYKLKLLDKKRHQSIFDFPVINYYKKLGFNLHSGHFEELSVRFIDSYTKLLKDASLHNNAIQVLEKFRTLNKNQVVLSAMEFNSLEEVLNQHQIRHYFNEVLGLDNIYAESKVAIARNYITKYRIASEETILIGDTLHDFEVACEIGADCLLIANGHQSYQRLKKTGVPVYHSLTDMILEMK